MKLKTFHAENMPANSQRGKLTITISRKTHCSISDEAAKHFGLKEGDKIAFHQDETIPEDWYISRHDTGFELRKSNSKPLLFNNTKTANILLDSLNLVDDKAVFNFAKDAETLDGVKYFVIITAKNIYKPRK